VTFHWSEFTGREPFIFLPGSLLDALHVVVDASAVQFFPTCFMPGLPLLPPLRVTPGSSLHQSRRPRPSWQRCHPSHPQLTPGGSLTCLSEADILFRHCLSSHSGKAWLSPLGCNGFVDHRFRGQSLFFFFIWLIDYIFVLHKRAVKSIFFFFFFCGFLWWVSFCFDSFAVTHLAHRRFQTSFFFFFFCVFNCFLAPKRPSLPPPRPLIFLEMPHLPHRRHGNRRQGHLIATRHPSGGTGGRVIWDRSKSHNHRPSSSS